MSNLYLVVLLPVIWIHFLVACATIATPESHPPVRVVRWALFAVVSLGEGFLLWQLGAGVWGLLLLPFLGAMLGLQGKYRLPVVSELIYIVVCIGCIVGIASLATPSTTWGDGFKLLGLTLLPPSLSFSTLLVHQLRFKPLYGTGKLVVGLLSLVGSILLATALPGSDYAGDSDTQVLLVALNAALLQLGEGIVALKITRLAARIPPAQSSHTA